MQKQPFSTEIVLRKQMIGFEPGVLKRIQETTPRRQLEAGAYLFRQNDWGSSMYIVISGRLRAFVTDAAGNNEIIGEIVPGDWVGELSLLTQSPRSATVQAIRDSELMEITDTVFTRLSQEEPTLALQLARTVTTRLQQMIRQPRQHARISTVALVPLHPSVPLAPIVHRLRAILSRTNRSEIVSSAKINSELGGPLAQEEVEHWDQNDSRLARYLSQVEQQNDFTLLQADFEWSQWTRRCLRMADLIFLVADASVQPGHDAIGDHLFGDQPYPVHAQKELVLIHAGSGKAGGQTASWLAQCPVEAHYHLRTGYPPDFERLGRRLTGTEVALTLSGGGARGFVHIGVIRAVRELDIPIDRVSGTSMGAVIGALLACGLSTEDITAYSYHGWQRMGATRDYTLPIVSLLTGYRASKMLHMMFGDRLVEELWLPYFAVSSNLTRGHEIVHRSGRIRDALRVSISMPGMAPPVPHNGDLLVDGAVLNNLPADIQQRQTYGRTIAVDCNPAVDLRAECDYGPTLSAGRLLWSRLNPFTQTIKVPNIYAIIDRVSLLNSVRQAAALDQDENILYLHPETDKFGLLDFKRIHEIADAGYQHALPRLEGWRRP